jgi:hypothetical protein
MKCKACNYAFLGDLGIEFCSQGCADWIANGNLSYLDLKRKQDELSPGEDWEKLPWRDERRTYWERLLVRSPRDQRGTVQYQDIIDATDRAEARRLARLAPKSSEYMREFNIKFREAIT